MSDICNNCQNCQKYEIFKALYSLQSDRYNNNYECPISTLTSMIVSCKNKTIIEKLFHFYFLIEEKANPIQIINIVGGYINTLKKSKDKDLLINLYNCNLDYRDYIDDKKFAKKYVYYRLKFDDL